MKLISIVLIAMLLTGCSIWDRSMNMLFTKDQMLEAYKDGYDEGIRYMLGYSHPDTVPDNELIEFWKSEKVIDWRKSKEF